MPLLKISLAQILATIWAFFLPSVQKSIYFNQEPVENIPLSKRDRIKKAFQLLWSHFISSYSNSSVVKWSIWWAMATCGFIQVQSYMQPLWAEIDPNHNSHVYNGAVEAVLTLLGAIAAMCASCLKTNWTLMGELVLTVCSIISGTVLLITSQTNTIWISYCCYIVFGSLYYFIITIVSAEVAKDIPEDTYGLVFGLNTLVALALQSIGMVIIVDGNIGFGLSPKYQYLVYGGYFMGIAFIYIVIGLINWCYMRRSSHVTY